MTPQQATSFGEQLRRYRERAGLTQEELAEKAGLTASAIGALERGTRRRPYPSTVRLLSAALALTAEESAVFTAAAPRRSDAESEGRRSAPSGLSASNPSGLSASGRSLPLQRTTLIGRRGEIAELHKLVRHRETHLITMTGVGGCGKTRLALHVAEEVQDAFADGVWVVALAAVADPTLVAQAVATVLDVRESPGVALIDSLVTALESRSLLLVLDNCEHLLDACTELVDRLLATCPGVRILATSREVLQVRGERQWRLLPLAVPDPDLPVSLDELAGFPSVQLLVERAEAAAGFRLTAANAAAVAQICARLAGIPLALELAAARVRVLTVEQIVERLDDALRLLTSGARAAPTRQQTLRATMDWSYELLTEPERALLRRLTVFAGGCDIEAIEAVCGTVDSGQWAIGGGEPPEPTAHCPPSIAPEHDVLDLLARLVDKSLVQVEDDGRSARYRLLEPVRQHAAQHLAAGDDGETAAARHAAYFLNLAERAEPELRGPEQVAWLERLDREQANLRAALRWAQTQRDTEIGVRLAGALVGFWEGRGYLSEGRRWLETMLAAGPATTPSHTRVKALLGAGHVAQWQADLDAADALLEESLAIARALDDRHLVAESLAWLGTINMRRNEAARAVALLDESLVLYRAESDRAGIAFALLVLGVAVGNHGDVSQAQALLEESVSLFRQLGDVRYVAITLTMLGAQARVQGDLRRAMILLREGLTGHREVGDRAFLMESLLQLAGVATARGQVLRAARLLGATEAARSVLGVALAPTNGSTQESFVAAIRAQLAEAEFAAVWAAGRAMTLEEAIAEATTVGGPAPLSPARGEGTASESRPAVLTPRQEEVTRLIARECTDRQIAASLGITVGTVGIHVHHILVKLGVRSRWQIADWALAHGLVD